MLIRFALDLCLTNIRRTFTSVLLVMLCLLLIVFTVLIKKGQVLSYETADALLTYGVRGTAVVRVEEQIVQFYEDVCQQPEVEAFGSIYPFAVDPIPELTEIQEAHLTDDMLEGYLNIISVDHSVLQITELHLHAGMQPDTLAFPPQDAGQKETEYLYLGYGFRDIEVGTVYDTEYVKYVVAGILEPSQHWFDASFINGVGMGRSDYTIDCTYRILCTHNSLPDASDLWLCAADGYTIEQALDTVELLAEQYDTEVAYHTLQTAYEVANEDWLVVQSILMRLIVLVSVSCTIMLICVRFVDVYYHMKDFGVMYAMGFSQAEIRNIVVIKNVLIAAMAFVLMIPLSVSMVKFFFSNDELQTVLVSLLLETALPLSVAVLFAVVLIMSAASTAILRRYTPVQMIGGCND